MYLPARLSSHRLTLPTSRERRLQISAVSLHTAPLLNKIKRLDVVYTLLDQPVYVKVSLDPGDDLAIRSHRGIMRHKKGTAVLIGHDGDVIRAERDGLPNDLLLIHADE